MSLPRHRTHTSIRLCRIRMTRSAGLPKAVGTINTCDPQAKRGRSYRIRAKASSPPQLINLFPTTILSSPHFNLPLTTKLFILARCTTTLPTVSSERPRKALVAILRKRSRDNKPLLQSNLLGLQTPWQRPKQWNWFQEFYSKINIDCSFGV